MERVTIEYNIKVVGKTIEEALARMAEKVTAAQLYEIDRQKIAKGYHYWDEENGGYVDWMPIDLVKKGNRGQVDSLMVLRVRNHDDN